MKDEIKEILDKLRSDDYYEKEYQKSVYYERDLKKLEDYITNLQEELEDYKSRVEKAVEYIGKPLDNYWEEEAQYLLNILNGDEDE